MESPFDVLGVDPDADEREIRRAYRERAKETHPDNGGSAEAFKRVRAAYEELATDDSTGTNRLNAGTGTGTETNAGAGSGRPRDDPGGPGRGGPGRRTGTWGRSGNRDWGRARGRRRDEDRDGHGPGDSRGPGQSGARVEYLNYTVLDDHGWSLDDDGLFEKAADAGLDHEDYGRFRVEPGESLLEAAENRGFAWPFACRGGACANCAVAVLEGDLSMPVDHILPREMMDRGIHLSCNAVPTTDELQVVYNVKHLPDLEELKLPPRPFQQAHSDD